MIITKSIRRKNENKLLRKMYKKYWCKMNIIRAVMSMFKLLHKSIILDQSIIFSQYLKFYKISKVSHKLSNQGTTITINQNHRKIINNCK